MRQLCHGISLQLRHVLTIEKKLLSSKSSSTCPHNMVNFGPLAAEIVSLIWSVAGNFQRVLCFGSVTAGHSNTGRHRNCGAEQTMPPVFGRVPIMFGIRPHFYFFFWRRANYSIGRLLPNRPFVRVPGMNILLNTEVCFRTCL